MKKIILLLLVVCATTSYAQEPLRKALKGERFISAFLGNDTYLGGKDNVKLKSQLLEVQYEYFLSNSSSIGVFGSYGAKYSKNDADKNSTPKYSDYSLGLVFNQRIASGEFLTKGFYSYVGAKAGYRGTTYGGTKENLMLGGLHIGAKWFLFKRFSLQLDLGGMIFSKEKDYGKMSFSPRIGVAYKL